MAQGALQTRFLHFVSGKLSLLRDRAQDWLWHERESLILWVPVAFGAGITAWFLLPGALAWLGFMMVMVALGFVGVLLGAREHRLPRAISVAAIAALLGCGVIWARSAWVEAPVLERPVIVEFSARVVSVVQLAARKQTRLLLATHSAASLPPQIRVTARQDAQGIERIRRGDTVRLRARLVPPPRAALPGGYDFARRAWFERIGAVGTLLGPITRAEGRAVPQPGVRERLSQHIRQQVSGGSGAIAAAFATGDRGGISESDDEAMRRAGLAHLLSISGLHVTAMVAGTMWLVIRILALFPWIALRWPLTLVAAGFGALAGLGYTLLTGGEVPTVRSLLAALLVLLALALGREAITMRLIATGAMVVMLLWPEAVVGPSFQLSFAAVASIVALHTHRKVKSWFARRDEAVLRRILRGLAALLATGLVVELALMPIALFHFHKAGLYGALANMIAIPLTTFVVMPAEALALALDSVGLGAPAWWVVQQALDAMLGLAHFVANAPGAVASFPTMPTTAFAMTIVGGLWVVLWQSQQRWLGLVGIALGLGWAAQVQAPDLLVTADGRHVAMRQSDGQYALLRERSGDFVRDQLAEAAGIDTAMTAIADMDGARCSPDFCVWEMVRGGRRWTILAARSAFQSDWRELVTACSRVDIVIADRWLPRACQPRWLKADRKLLQQTGGLAITLDPPRIVTAASPSSGMPWANPATILPPRPISLSRQPQAGIAARGLARKGRAGAVQGSRGSGQSRAERKAKGGRHGRAADAGNRRF